MPRGRRGEANFVAVSLGFWTDPKMVLGLAQRLGVAPGLAGSFVLRWEEFVLKRGDAHTGRVKEYTPLHLAVELGWQGKPGRLIEGMKEAGVIRAARGGAFIHPFWGETITGQYADRRARDRDRHREHGADGNSAELPRNEPGASAELPWRSADQGIKAEGAPPPLAPPAGGDDTPGQERWRWLEQNHNRPSNSRVCILYLEAMTEETWALCRWVVELGRNPVGTPYRKKKRVWAMDTRRFLSEEAYLQFLPEWRAKLKQGETPTNGAPKEPPIEVQEAGRHDARRRYLLAQLADPEVPPDKKREVVDRWNREHPDDQVPLPEVH